MEIIPVTKVTMSCMLIAVENSPHAGRKLFRPANERERERLQESYEQHVDEDENRNALSSVNVTHIYIFISVKEINLSIRKLFRLI